jgi:hypothetical protein
MVIYIILMFFSVAVFFLLRFIKNKELEYFLQAFWLFVIVFISGFRLDLGQDYEGYKRNFDDIDARESVEPFITLLTKVLYFLNLPYIFIFVTFSFLTFLFLLLFFKKYDKKIIYLSILIFIALPQFYFQTYNLIRQMLAVVIFAYASTFIGSKVKYIVCIFFCAMIHESVLFILPIVILLEIFKSFKIDKYLYFVSLIIFYNPSLLKSIIISIGSKLNFPYAEIYISNSDLDIFEYKMGIVLILNIFLVSFVLFKKEQFILIGLQREYNYFIIGQILFNFLSWESTIVRIGYYFLFFYILIIPSLILMFKGQISIVIQVVLVILYFSLFLYGITSVNNPFVPYKNYFFN